MQHQAWLVLVPVTHSIAVVSPILFLDHLLLQKQGLGFRCAGGRLCYWCDPCDPIYKGNLVIFMLLWVQPYWDLNVPFIRKRCNHTLGLNIVFTTCSYLRVLHNLISCHFYILRVVDWGMLSGASTMYRLEVFLVPEIFTYPGFDTVGKQIFFWKVE